MKEHSPLIRAAALFLAMLLISTSLTTRLVYIQVLQDPAEVSASKNPTRTYVELASRGEIFDRNGTPLVSNSLGFSVELDYYNWNKTLQNDVILQLTGILSAAGAVHSDELPITTEPPYEYTHAGPESTAAKKLAKFVASKKNWPENPDAPTLFALLCDEYGIEKEMLLRDKRTIAGVRYYLDMCEFSAHNTPVSISSNIDIDTVAKISELSLELPGVSIQVDDVRSYETEYAAHILGRVAVISPEEYAVLKSAEVPYLMTDTLGKEGMEKALEGYLRGINGLTEQEVSRATGEVIRESVIEPPDPGDSCWLTIDIELQMIAEQALELGLESVRIKGEASKDGKGADVEGGAIVVLDARTFDVLAMASYPTYSLSSYSADFAVNTANPLRPLFNRTVQGAYPPGSTFKMATAVAALEEGVVSPTAKIRDEGVYRYYESYQPACWIYNTSKRTHGNINISEALKYSCNYFFYETGRILAIDRLNTYASALGLGQKTGIELPGEVAGTLDGPEARAVIGEPWYDGMTLAAAIGQAGQQFTPIQLAAYMATILNGGERYRPHLLRRVVDYTGERIVFEQQPELVQRLDLKESTVKAIKEGMFGVVTEDGTASSYFRNFPLDVGGKTGSAESRSGRSAHGVFISFAPYDDPEIVVVVIGEYAGTGGGMSPVCIEIYNHYFGLSVDVGLITKSPEPPPAAPPAATTPPATTEPPQTTEPSDEPSDDEPDAETTEPSTEPEQTTAPAETQPPETEQTTAPPETEPQTTTAPQG